MRCTNCGWENSGDRSNCEKCNSPLSNYAMREHAVTDVYARRTVNENIGINVGRPTVCEQGDSVTMKIEKMHSFVRIVGMNCRRKNR